MGVYCVLCGNHSKSASYHRFPKENNIREQWLTFCGIKEETLNSATFLCSHHFQEKDLKQKLNCTVAIPGAIPSIRVPKKGHKRSNVVNKPTYELEMKQVELNKVEPVIAIERPFDNHDVQDLTNVDTSLNSDGSSEEFSTDSHGGLANAFVQAGKSETPPKTIPEPRYVGDIRSPHLATPRRAKRAVALAKSVIIKQKRSIKMLQQSRNRLYGRIKSIKDLVNELKKKDLISEVAFNSLTASLHRMLVNDTTS